MFWLKLLYGWQFAHVIGLFKCWNTLGCTRNRKSYRIIWLMLPLNTHRPILYVVIIISFSHDAGLSDNIFCPYPLFWTCFFWRTWELVEPRHRKRSGTSTWKWFSKAKGGRTDWRLLNVRYGEARHFARAIETLRGLRSNACPIYSRQPVSEGLDASIVRLSLWRNPCVSAHDHENMSAVKQKLIVKLRQPV